MTGCARVKRTAFQPIWGTRSVSGNRRTVAGHPAEAVGRAFLAVIEQHLEPDADAEERDAVVEHAGRGAAR